MDAMVNIIKHHLAKDGSRPLEVTTTSPQDSSSGDVIIKYDEILSCPETAVEGQLPDKIIVYSYFIENFPLIEKVSVLSAYHYSLLRVMTYSVRCCG